MSNPDNNTSPKVFISYAWENQPVAKQLQRDLQRDGVEVFVDYEKISGGDSLPARISAALDWCNTLVLLWSVDSADSYYVSQEWESAFHLHKRIVPIVLDGTQLPALLRARLYLDISSYATGYKQLCRALGVKLGKVPKAKASKPKINIRSKNVNLREDDFKKKIPASFSDIVSASPVSLRSKAQKNLSEEDVKNTIKRHNFYCDVFLEWGNPDGKGMNHNFDLQQNGLVIYDHSTDLSWQQAGSKKSMTFQNAIDYVDDLNFQNFASHNNWRLPTLEEAMSLMEPHKYNNLYIDPKFDSTQEWIWTGDKEASGASWVVGFYGGGCNYGMDGNGYIRVVR